MLTWHRFDLIESTHLDQAPSPFCYLQVKQIRVSQRQQKDGPNPFSILHPERNTVPGGHRKARRFGQAMPHLLGGHRKP